MRSPETRARRASISLLLFFVLGLATPAAAAAQATTYVPDQDPAYGDADALIAAGWVRTVIAGRRPFSRLTLARMVVEARSTLARAAAVPGPRFTEALDRLERVFGPEIQALCTEEGTGCPSLPTGVRVRSLAADATWAASPSRAIPTSYDARASRIDAELNPLLQSNQGRILADGGTVGLEALADVQLGTRLAAQIRPRLWTAAPAAGGSDTGATLLEGYARALVGNAALEVGRNHIASGHGRHGGTILSDNARGLDLVRLSLDRSARLPWVLRALGPIGVSALLADLGASSDTPHSKLVVFEGSMRPHPNLEVGGTLLNHQGGGGPPATFGERLRDIFFVFEQQNFISDRVVGWDVRLTLPSARTQLNVEMMTTDTRWELMEPFTTEAAWLGGVRVFGLGPDGRADLWAEARYAGVRPHTHHQFTSGLTLDGRVIGDALGPVASGLAAGIDWRGAAQTVSLSVARERYSGADLYEDVQGDAPFAWIRIEDRPDEVRVRVLADWTMDGGWRGLSPSVRVGYERVARFAFTPESRSNGLLQLRLEYRP